MQNFNNKYRYIFILFLIWGLLIPPIYKSYSESSADDKIANKNLTKKITVKTINGLIGEARVIADFWLKKEKEFISLKFIPSKKRKFIKLGTLVGQLQSGEVISIEIQEDFNSSNPGMIREHLNALKYRAEILPLGKEALKKQLNLRKDFKAWRISNEEKLQDQIKSEINDRIQRNPKRRISPSQKADITRQVQAEYALKSLRRLEAMKKRFKDKGVIWEPPMEPGAFEKIIIWIKQKAGF